MELKKENIHRMGGSMAAACSSATFTLDDDFNVPDAKPDVKMILRENGRIRVMEKKCNAGRLHIRGVLLADVLYIGEDGTGVYGMESELPFDEMIHIDREDCNYPGRTGGYYRHHDSLEKNQRKGVDYRKDLVRRNRG